MYEEMTQVQFDDMISKLMGSDEQSNHDSATLTTNSGSLAAAKASLPLPLPATATTSVT